MAKNTTADKSPPKPNPKLDRIWNAVFDVYKDRPATALTLAQNFRALQDVLQDGKDGAQQVIATIDCAIENLFEYSEFRNVGHSLFCQAVQGVLTPETEKALHKLGIRT